jgi:WD40 repeat protein
LEGKEEQSSSAEGEGSFPGEISQPRTDEWRRGGVREGAMSAHVLVQSDCVAVSSVDESIVCIGGDGADDGLAVSVYSPASGEAVRHYRGHTDKVLSVACEGKLIASGGRDKTIRLWSAGDDDACIATLSGCEGDVYGLALRGDLLLSGERGVKGAKARLWRLAPDRRQSKCFAVLSGHKGNIWSVALGGTPTVAVSAGNDATARVWPVDGGTRALSSLKHPKWVTSCSVCGATLATGCADANVRLWSLETFECLRTVNHGGGDELSGLNWLSVHLIRSSVLLSGGQDCSVKLWDLSTAVPSNKTSDTKPVTTLAHGDLPVRGIVTSRQLGWIGAVGGKGPESLVIWRPASSDEEQAVATLMAAPVKRRMSSSSTNTLHPFYIEKNTLYL